MSVQTTPPIYNRDGEYIYLDINEVIDAVAVANPKPLRVLPGSFCLVRDVYGVITGMRYTAVDANGLTTCNDVPTCVACGTVAFTVTAFTYPGNVAIASRSVLINGPGGAVLASGVTNSGGSVTFNIPSSAGAVVAYLGNPGGESPAWDSTTTPAGTTTTGTGYAASNTVANTGETAALTNFRVATGSTPPPPVSP